MSLRLLVHSHSQPSPATRRIHQRPILSWSLSLRFNSTAARPFKFHIGVAWAAKPPDPKLTRFHAVFAADSQLGKWRDAMLSSPKQFPLKDAGEDFFYHTEVCPFVFTHSTSCSPLP
ncbi:hypothetical protein JVU11DRAFT_566 [Chiua virens]|nr:hypothetical protein JVU11DRAFT_566 [Chiua virens]